MILQTHQMTRQDILEAAAQIISQKGFHAASMRDIARAVDLRKASLYHHVSSKQEILLDLLDQALDLLIADLTAIVARPTPPDRKLRQALHAYMRSLAEHSELSSVLLFEHRSLTPEYRSRHIPRRDQFERLWRDLIQEGIDAGVFAAPDPSIATKSLLGTMNWFITWYRPDGALSHDEIADLIADLYLNGLSVRGK